MRIWRKSRDREERLIGKEKKERGGGGAENRFSLKYLLIDFPTSDTKQTKCQNNLLFSVLSIAPSWLCGFEQVIFVVPRLFSSTVTLPLVRNRITEVSIFCDRRGTNQDLKK